jgi:hypothetical protein
VVVGTTSDRPIDAVEVELGAPHHSSLILEVQVSDQVWAVAEVAAPDAVAVAAPVAFVEDERFALPVDDGRDPAAGGRRGRLGTAWHVRAAGWPMTSSRPAESRPARRAPRCGS